MPGLQRLVLVLPGIGGSVLARPDDLDDVVWDAGKGDIADLAVRPRRMALAEIPRLEPIGLTRSTKLLGFTVVPGYERLLDRLSHIGRVDAGDPRRPVPAADVVAVPYDFRRGVVEAAEQLDAVVTRRLAGLSESEKTARLVIVAHSLGGLVARYWLGPCGRWPWCRALITLGTPHRGAPKALDWLVNGVRVGGARLERPTRLLREWPSVTQLAPRYPAALDVSVPAAEQRALFPHELPIHWLRAGAGAAYELHLEIERAWLDMPRGGPEMVACIGWSHPTPDAAFWDGRALTVTKEPPHWLGLTGREKDFGDGTVPSVSALPIELDNHISSPIRLLDRHVPMASADIVTDLVTGYLGIAPPRQVRGDETGRRPALGLDVAELQVAGDPIPVAVAVREVDTDPSGLAVWATLHRSVLHETGGGSPARVRLDWDPARSRFSGSLPGQRPGLVTLQVTVREVPSAGDLMATDTVAVVEGE